MNHEQFEMIAELQRQYADSMVQLTFRRISDWHLAEDLVQETFLIAYYKAKRTCTHEKPIAWLFDILNKLTMRECARAYHTSEVYASPLYTPDKFIGVENLELPMEHYLPAELNQDERELILMRVEQGLSFEAIAEHFGIKEDACRQRFSRMMRKCRKLLDEEHSGQAI